MNKGFSILTGIGLGAGLMYLWDPDRGQRRRNAIRDEACRILDKTDEAIAQAGQNLRHRARGVAIETLAMLNGNENHLETPEMLANNPDLQSRRSSAETFELQQKKGSPTGRLLNRLGGGVLLLYGRRRGGWMGKSLGAMGMGMALQGINHVEWKRLLRSGNGRHPSAVEEKAA